MDENKDYFKIREKAGGLFNFEGVIANAKPISNIIVNNNSVTVNYEDNNQYSITAAINKVANTTTISSITETWNNVTTSQKSAIEGIIAMLLANNNSHADILEYKDNQYTVPQSITPETGETFDSIIETWKVENDDDIKIVWGVGILNKGQNNEKVNRLIFPDSSQISLINF